MDPTFSQHVALAKVSYLMQPDVVRKMVGPGKGSRHSSLDAPTARLVESCSTWGTESEVLHLRIATNFLSVISKHMQAIEMKQ